MVNENLNMAIDELRLGNGSVYNFIDYIGGYSLTGGIKRYTLSRGFFYNNLSRNFSGGLYGRYGYGRYGGEDTEKIHGTDAKKLVRGQLVPATLWQDRVGDYYTTNFIPFYRKYDFFTISDFTDLGRALREWNTNDNVKEDTFKNRYSEANSEEKFLAKGVMQTQLGDETVSVESNTTNEQLFKDRKPIEKSYDREREELRSRTDEIAESVGVLDEEQRLYREQISTTGVYQGDPNGVLPRKGTPFIYNGDFSVDFEHKIDSVGRKIRDRYATKRIFNKVVENKIGRNDSYGEKIHLMNDFGQVGPTQISIPSEGLYIYYENNRNNSLFKGKSSRNNMYGYDGTDTSEYYVLPLGELLSTYKSKEGVAISNKVKGGTLRQSNKTQNGGTFTYYQENDAGTPVMSFNSNTNVSDGFTPKIGTEFSSNPSKLMDRTNRLFNNNKAKSLINRFHTEASKLFEDDETVTSYTNGFGMSRGRNLLRKQYEGKNVGDRSTGFDNPYCRVWTAHYQYATMKDRIRPFMDGNEFMSIGQLQSNYGNLRPNGTILSDYTVLQDSGFVKIAPHRKDGLLADGKEGLKKYMFSIENLAWKNFTTYDWLSEEQRGPNNGRIMWFPPYNLKFTENINTNWRDNEFIGRGEKIYTYANTERSGTLSFTMLIDHPSIVNKWAGSIPESDKEAAEKDLLRFFAGCGTLEIEEKEEPIVPTMTEFPEEDNKDDKTPLLDPDEQYIEFEYIMFFPNNFSAKKYSSINEIIEKIDGYEMTSDSASTPAFKEMDKAYEKQILGEKNYDNWSLYSLNTTAGLNQYIDDNGNPSSAATAHPLRRDIEKLLGCGGNAMSYEELKKLSSQYTKPNGEDYDENGSYIFGFDTRDYEIAEIELRGFASDHGYPAYNAILSRDRAETIGKLAKAFCGEVDETKFVFGDCETIDVTKPGLPKYVNDLYPKIARSAVVTFKIKVRDDVRIQQDLSDYDDGQHVLYDGGMLDEAVVVAERNPNGKTKMATIHNGISPQSFYTYQNEYLYFKNIEATNKMVYKNIVDKVKFFEPAFHSITPEGFNARLNFLQQCTRQGPTTGSHSGGELDLGPGSTQNNYLKRAGNLAFGTAPYCILRIGDFYYSKICITSISIDYATDSGIQWDLNPEGAGVQPMSANININFNFIGGQDMSGPVDALQNAISHNYYANSSVYTTDRNYYPENIENK